MSERKFSDRYQLQDRIDGSDTIEMFKARDGSFPRNVFITQFPNHDHSAVSVFRSRVQSLAQLSHHNIMSIFDMECEAEHCYVISEYHEGITLGEAMEQEERFSLEEGLYIAIHLADAIAHAHELQVIHGQLTSDLVWLRGRDIKISFLYPEADGIEARVKHDDLRQLGNLLKELFSATPSLYKPAVRLKVDEVTDRLQGKRQPGYQTASDVAYDLKMILAKDVNHPSEYQPNGIDTDVQTTQTFAWIQAERNALFTAAKPSRLRMQIGKFRSFFLSYMLVVFGTLLAGAAASFLIGNEQTTGEPRVPTGVESAAVSVAMAETPRQMTTVTISPSEPITTLSASEAESSIPKIPDLVGKTKQEAETILLSKNIRYEYHLKPSPDPLGTVYKQELGRTDSGKPKVIFYVSSEK